ncbi:MAG: rRNA maturation RNase YbeY [Chitinophagaceae bacterium]|nr:rRNA maturation RNase YbeY [Chitinophagaceae bacterium]
MPKVSFYYLEVKPSFIKDKNKLKRFLQSLFKKEGIKLETLNYIFCTDDYLLGINQQFLQHKYYTDIITFNLAHKNQPVQGEIYISLDRVRENAQTHQTSFKEEIHRVVFHGALHLCGYRDKTAAEIAKMRKGEAKYLQAYL